MTTAVKATSTPAKAAGTPENDKWSPFSVLSDEAAILYHERNPAEEIVAGKLKKTRQGAIVGINVLYSSNKAKIEKAEIDKIGKVFDVLRKQPADKKTTVDFKFGGEEYHATAEKCSAADAFCFSGSKHKLGSRGIYAMMTREGYVVIVKTKSFTATQAAVENGKGLIDEVRKAAIKYAMRQARRK